MGLLSIVNTFETGVVAQRSCSEAGLHIDRVT